MSSSARAPVAPGSSSRMSPSRPMRFIIIFAVFFLLGYGVLLTPPGRVADGWFSRTLVGASHLVILGCGGHAFASGPVLQSASGQFGVEMQDGCNGVNVTILLWSAMLAFPATWKMKALGLGAGTLLILAVNTVRFISLFYLGQYSMAWFEFAHKYLWESLLMLDTMIVFGVWVTRTSLKAASNVPR